MKYENVRFDLGQDLSSWGEGGLNAAPVENHRYKLYQIIERSRFLTSVLFFPTNDTFYNIQ